MIPSPRMVLAFCFFIFTGVIRRRERWDWNIAKDRKVIPDPIDDRKFQE
jgi:hypothetical protein